MIVTLDIPDYDGNVLDVIWEDGSQYSIDVYEDKSENEVTLFANKERLISLAKQMLYFANNDLPKGSHIHFDNFFTKFNYTKYDLTIVKIDE